MKINRQAQILVVDDDPDYTFLLERALQKCKQCPTSKVFHSGKELLEWLAKNQRPSLIFLDINMPISNGFDVLKALKAQEQYKVIPVVMLTVSEERNDIVSCYDIGANAYLTKPASFADLVARMDLFSQYWFDVVQTPDSTWLSKAGYSTYN